MRLGWVGALAAGLLTQLLTLSASSSDVTAAPRGRTPPEVAAAPSSEEQGKVQALVLGEALYRINEKDDNALASALLQLRQATTPQDVSRIFRDSLRAGKLDVSINRGDTVALMKAGAQVFLKGSTSDAALQLIDKIDSYVREVEAGPTSVQIAGIPREYSSVLLAGGISQLNPELRQVVTLELASYMNRKVKDIEQTIRDNKIGSTQIGDRSAIDARLHDAQVAVLKGKLDIDKEVLDATIKGTKVAQTIEQRKQELESESKRLESAVVITGLVLGPIVGSETTNKVTTIGNGLVQMNQAIKTFGPSGITPDKLLMFTNFATAGLAVTGMLMSASQPDPTMVALQGIMQQLTEIKKQLERIEGKIDDLTDIVLLGFDKVLKGQLEISQQIADFEKVVKGQIKDEEQYKAIQQYLQYLVESGSLPYKLRLQCANPQKVTDKDAQDCLERFALLLSKKMILTTEPDKETRPELFSPIWSNQFFSAKNIGVPEDRQLALEQLSYPFYFAANPKAFRSMIARNHEAVGAYSNYVVHAPHPDTVPNPEVLSSQLSAYLAAARVHHKFRTSYAGPLTEQAIGRVKDVAQILDTTVGNKDAMNQLISMLATDLDEYQNAVKSVWKELLDDPYSEDRNRLNDKMVMKGCTPGYPDISVPVDAKTHQAADTFVPQMYWVAQELGLGRIAQCYEWAQVPKSKVNVGNAEYYQITFRVKVFFNPSPRTIDGRLSPAELPSIATAFDKNKSKMIAVQRLDTKNHYTTWYGVTAPIFAAAWSGGAVYGGLHDVYECWDPNPKPMRPRLTDECITKPDRYIPRDRFVSDSISEQPPEDAKKNLELVTKSVHAVLASIITARSDIWNPQVIAYEDNKADKSLTGRRVSKEDFLANALKSYTRKVLLAQNWLLLSHYHQNPISRCLARLDKFSPKRVVADASANLLDLENSISLDFKKEMSDAPTLCSSHALHPELQRIRSQLERLHLSETAKQ
jgi:hypothetical protein